MDQGTLHIHSSSMRNIDIVSMAAAKIVTANLQLKQMGEKLDIREKNNFKCGKRTNSSHIYL